MKKLILVATISMLAACSDSNPDDAADSILDGAEDAVDQITDEIAPDTDTENQEGSALLRGIQAGPTVGNVAETIAALEGILSANDAISIVAQVDHQQNAANNGLELRPTRVTLFGNPRLGTPLMQINQLAGLDLPQNMFAWTDAEGQSNIAYNSAEYLSGRHGLADAQETLDTINGALAGLATNAGGQEFVPVAGSAPGLGEGIVVVPSANDMDTTYNNLRGAIDAAEPLTIVAELDHSANAASVELTLAPTRLIVFGNPNLGTPLMQSGQSIGIDLPQKMLVYENAEGQVAVAYNDPAYLAARHGITDQQGIIDTVTQALGGLAANATAAP